MKKLLLSYDYELYFNESYVDENESLIEPSNSIFESYLKTDVRCTFFVDTECIFRYKALGKNEFVKSVEIQLKKFISNGFDVQLHLHPLWDKTSIVNGNTSFDYSFYDIKSIGLEIIERMILNGKNYLEKLLRTIDPSYKCIAFRAGGFCFPNTKEFTNILKNNGFLIDSSILPNTYLNSRYQKYNFFGKNKILNSEEISEVPILSCSKRSFHYIFGRKKARLNPCLRGKGSPVVFEDGRVKRFFCSLVENAIITLDTHNYFFIRKCIEKNKSNVVSLIGHPKLENQETIDNTINLIKISKKDFTFLTFSEYLGLIYEKNI